MDEAFKLDFDNLEICGRSEELRLLRSALHRACDLEKPACEVVMIEGASGTGKSALVNAFGDSLNPTRYFLCKGKFDQGLGVAEPLSAFVHCINDMGDGMMSESADKWRDILEKSMGRSELRAMSRLSPPLKKVLAPKRGHMLRDSALSVNSGQQVLGSPQRGHTLRDSLPRTRNDSDSVNSGLTSAAAMRGGQPISKWGFERLRLALRNLIRAICACRPVVFAVDDLQWADEASLSVIRTLFNDIQARCFLFIGTNRPVETDHPLSKLKCEVMHASKLTSIAVGCLSEEHIKDILTALLRRDRDDTDSLAHVIHRKTGGSAFTVIQFISLLEQKGLIFYSLNKLRWDWDVSRIIGATDVTNNSVLDILTEKLTAMPKALQNVLSSAAFLGPSRFNVEVISRTMIFHSEDQGSDQGFVVLKPMEASLLKASLSTAVEEGLLDVLNSEDLLYKFSHDRVKECAHNLLPTWKKTKALHLAVGRELRQIAREMAIDEEKDVFHARSNVLLLAVHHLNLGADLVVDPDEKLDLVKLNEEAAHIALEMSSVFPAAEFLEAGLNLLDKKLRWIENYDLTLAMTCTLAHVCFCCNLEEKSVAATDDVLNNACCLLDKLPAYKTRVVLLTRKGKQLEAVDVLLFVLQALGFFIPRRGFIKLYIALSVVKIKWMLRSLSREELLNRPDESDPLVVEGGEFVFLLADIAASSQNTAYLGLSVVNGCFQLLRCDRMKETSGCLTACAMMHQMLNDYHAAQTYAKLALEMAHENRYPNEDARTILLIYGLVAHWKQPFHNCLEPVLQSFKVLRDLGHVEYLYMAMIFYSFLYFVSGLALEPIYRDMMGFIELLEDFGQSESLELFRPQVQLVLNFIGRGDDTVNGEATEQDSYLRGLGESDNTRSQEVIYTARMVLGYYFDNLPLAEEMSLKLISISKHRDVNIWTSILPFFHGLVAASLARSTGKRRYVRKARGFARQLEKYVKAGNVNCFHMLKILEAELLSQRGDAEAVQRAYDEAIVVAGRHGFMNHQALANERAGKYFLDKDDTEWARTYLKRAYELYGNWNAASKVDQIETKYGYLLGTSPHLSVIKSSVIRGRSRLKEMENPSASLSTESLVFGLGAQT